MGSCQAEGRWLKVRFAGLRDLKEGTTFEAMVVVFLAYAARCREYVEFHKVTQVFNLVLSGTTLHSTAFCTGLFVNSVHRLH